MGLLLSKSIVMYNFINNLTKNLYRPFILKIIICVQISLIILYGILMTLRTNGAVDFHSYWISGIYLRQKIDPYTGFIEKKSLDLPISFINGNIRYSHELNQEGLANVPANTAPVVLLLYPLSFLSWNYAKFTWLLINIILMLLIPLSTLSLFSEQKINTNEKLIIFIIFLCLYGTRNTLSSGQTTFLIYILMLSTILFSNRSTLLGSLCFGLALSKYSLSLPVLILLALQKKYKIIILGFLLQFLSLLVISIYTMTHPLDIVNAYINIALIHKNLPGVHLYYWTKSNFITIIISSLLIILVIGVYLSSKMNEHIASNRLIQVIVYCMFSFLSLLVVYHRAYDTIIILPIFALIILASKPSSLLNPNGIWKIGHIIYSIILFVSLTLPASGIPYIIHFFHVYFGLDWTDFQLNLITFVLISTLVILAFVTNGYLYKKWTTNLP